MAHKKAGGSTRLGRDSQAQRLGVKAFTGQQVLSGNIIVRQRGSRLYAGQNVGKGKDDTLYALTDGVVRFSKKTRISFTGKREEMQLVSVQSTETISSRVPLSKTNGASQAAA